MRYVGGALEIFGWFWAILNGATVFYVITTTRPMSHALPEALIALCLTAVGIFAIWLGRQTRKARTG